MTSNSYRRGRWLATLSAAAALLGVLCVGSAAAVAAEPYFLVPDVPTDLGPATFFPWEVVRNDNGSFSSDWSLPSGVAINALNYNSTSDVLFSVAATADLGGTLYEPRDVVRWNGVNFAMFFDGSAETLPPDAVIDSILMDQVDLVIGFAAVTTIGTQTFEPGDLVRVTAGTFSLYLDASATTPPIPAGTNVTAADRMGDSTILTFDVPTSLGPFTYHPGELVAWDGSGFTSLYVEPAWPSSSRVHGLTVDPASCTDTDGDGYGSPGNSLCSAGPEEDCDDSNAAVNPGADEVGCDGLDNDCDAGTPDVFDADSDGFDCDTDCDDAEPDVNPGAAEIGCDGVDNDCDEGTPDVLDADEDGHACDTDCDDAEPAVNPGAAEIGCDGLDNDCDEGTPDVLDADEDGFACDTDCDDAEPTVNPGAAEALCDDVDNDCDAGTPDVADGDGDGFACDTDCDDGNSDVNPGAAETECDGVDNDCNPATADLVDADRDTYTCDVDCDDGNAGINPGAAEIGCDEVDNDCNPATPDVFDGDGDGFACDTDCDDGEAGVNPGAEEVGCDGIDNDCNPATADVLDADGDGFNCNFDCNDDDPDINPGEDEIGCDGVDNDCVPATPDVRDADGDLFDCDVDCDDGNADVNPGAAEIGCDGLDNDCNGATPDLADGDGDGFACDNDCNDADADVNPGAAEVGCDGIDNDCNAATGDVQDGDDDGVACDTDCDDANGDAWSTPGDVLALMPTGDGRTLVWSAPANPGASPGELVYDVLSSSDASDFVNDATCVLTDTSQTSVDDPNDPSPDGIFYYLVRAQSPCPSGEGTVGIDSSGVPRLARTCP